MEKLCLRNIYLSLVNFGLPLWGNRKSANQIIKLQKGILPPSDLLSAALFCLDRIEATYFYFLFLNFLLKIFFFIYDP